MLVFGNTNSVIIPMSSSLQGTWEVSVVSACGYTYTHLHSLHLQLRIQVP